MWGTHSPSPRPLLFWRRTKPLLLAALLLLLHATEARQRPRGSTAVLVLLLLLLLLLLLSRLQREPCNADKKDRRAWRSPAWRVRCTSPGSIYSVRHHNRQRGRKEKCHFGLPFFPLPSAFLAEALDSPSSSASRPDPVVVVVWGASSSGE